MKLIEKKILNFKMYLDKQDEGISKELLEHGYRERFSVDCIKKILRPDMNVLDLGANIGFYVLIESPVVNHVYAIEPVEYNYNLLSANIGLNNCKNVSTFRNAISSKTGKGKIYTSNRCNWATIVDKNNRTEDYSRRWDKFAKGFENVEMFTLDDFTSKYDIKPDLIRMDVEGAEVDIIGGGLNTINNMAKDSYLVIEIHSSCIKDKDSIGKMLDKTKEAGFEVFKVVNRLQELPVEKVADIRDYLIYRVGCPQVFFKKV